MSDIEIIKKYGSIENYIYELEQEIKQLKEKIRILTEHPFISALNNGTAFNKKEISFIIRIDNGKAFKVEKELFDYVTDLEQKNIQLKEIIEKVREYIKENRLFMFEYDYDEYIFLGISDKEPRKELLQILDKSRRY